MQVELGNKNINEVAMETVCQKIHSRPSGPRLKIGQEAVINMGVTTVERLLDRYHICTVLHKTCTTRSPSDHH